MNFVCYFQGPGSQGPGPGSQGPGPGSQGPGPGSQGPGPGQGPAAAMGNGQGVSAQDQEKVSKSSIIIMLHMKLNYVVLGLLCAHCLG